MNNSLNTTTTDPDKLFQILAVIDITCRCYSLLIHIVYIILIFFSRKLKKRSLLYVNHATVVSIFYIINLVSYIGSSEPNFADQNLNAILCSISEFFWIFSNYIRMWSILLIAVYRYIAVFHFRLYKNINNSYMFLILPIILIWFISIICPNAFKYIFQTSPSSIFCLDGYSLFFTNTILYFLVNYLIMMLIPFIMVLTIYILIVKRLKKNETDLALNRRHARIRYYEGSQTTLAKFYKKKISKEQRFANQLIVMCSSFIVTACILSIFALRNVIPDYWNRFYYWRPVMRTIVACSISAIPITSIYYHPSRSKLVAKIFGINRIKPT